MRGCRMSYMNHSEFTPAGGIQELSFDEVEQVDGAIAPLVIIAVLVVVVLGAAFIGGAIDGASGQPHQ